MFAPSPLSKLTAEIVDIFRAQRDGCRGVDGVPSLALLGAPGEGVVAVLKELTELKLVSSGVKPA